ncbi:MAG: hypothetical protein JO027_09220 [Solirubrobacterales bacterium]|nr:hypothetical protein [Solirubrobacterales bacterium]
MSLDTSTAVHERAWSRVLPLTRAESFRIARRSTLIALAVYVAYALFLTWPLPTDPGGLISAQGLSGDLGGSISRVAYIVQHHVFPFAPATFHGLNAPEGVSQAWVLNWGSLVGTTLLYGFGYIFSPVAGAAIYLWLGFVASGMAMFLLTRRLFGNPWAALLAGFAFAYSPWAVQGMSGHADYMQGWVLVLSVWRMIELADRPTVRNGLLAGAATVAAMLLTPYFVLIGGVGFVTMAVIVLLTGVARGELLATVRGVFLAGAVVVLVFGAIGVLTVVAGGDETGSLRTESITQLYAYTARWREWVLPDQNNLIFGGLTKPYLTSHLHGSNFAESSIYLGDSVLLLALGGVFLGLVKLRRVGRAAARDIRGVAVAGGAALALVAAWFSAPPKVHLLGVWVPMPSWFVFHVTSTWRVYTRFVELIELGLCILLAFAATALLARRGRVASAVVIAALAAVLVLDLWARPPIRTTKVSAPAEYTWLKDHPGGIVADYPLEPAVFPNYAPLLWQMIDHHPIFQGYDANSDSELMKLDLVDLREPSTASRLAALGVRYIVVHPGQPGGDPANLTRQGYVLRFSGPDGSVWQDDARPAQTWVDGLQGFSVVEGGPNAEYRWMTGTGVLAITSRSCLSCWGVLTFQSASADLPRKLTVTDGRTGEVLATVPIPPDRSAPVRIPGVKLVGGQARLLLTTDIPALPPKDGDPRLLSISVGEPRFVSSP